MRKQLGQLRPANTSAASLYSPADARGYGVDVVACNVSAANVDVSIFHDKDGTTYDETTALVFTHTLAKGETLSLSKIISDYLEDGNVGVQSSVANAANFTAYGEEAGDRV